MGKISNALSTSRQYFAKKCVFRWQAKRLRFRAGSWRLSDSEFQVDGPATAKQQRPSVQSIPRNDHLPQTGGPRVLTTNYNFPSCTIRRYLCKWQNTRPTRRMPDWQYCLMSLFQPGIGPVSSLNKDYLSTIYFSSTISLFPVTCAVAARNHNVT